MIKGENAGYQHFLLFPQCFQKISFYTVVKSQGSKNSGLCGKKLYIDQFDFLPTEKILDRSKFKAFADDNIYQGHFLSS